MITIITPSLGFEDRLHKTYQSIEDLLPYGIKWLIKSNSSVELKHEFNNTKIACIPDTSICEASQQGLLIADSTYVQFMGAGDVVHPEIYKSFLHQHSDILINNNYDLISFNCYIESENHVMESNPNMMFNHMSMPFPSCIIRRELAISVGGFSSFYKIACDYDLLVKMIKAGARIKVFNNTLTTLEAGGISETGWLEGQVEVKLSLFRNQIRNQKQFASDLAGLVSSAINRF